MSFWTGIILVYWVGLVHGEPLAPVGCGTDFCIQPSCPDPVVRPGECCPVCSTKLFCSSGGNVYHDGQQFKSDCNICTCNQGQITCAQTECDAPKPGTCPVSTGFNTCVEQCKQDSSCPGDQKCCSNGCGRTCQSPVFSNKACFYKGRYYKHGETFRDDCNTCTCRNGNAECTRRTCVDCSSVACPAVNCEGHYKKPGDCCSSCPELLSVSTGP